MSHLRYTAHLGDRGRLVLPAEVRRRLDLRAGELLVIDFADEDSLVVRKATDVAHSHRGFLRGSTPDRDLAAELIAERRLEDEREADVPARS